MFGAFVWVLCLSWYIVVLCWTWFEEWFTYGLDRAVEEIEERYLDGQ